MTGIHHFLLYMVPTRQLRCLDRPVLDRSALSMELGWVFLSQYFPFCYFPLMIKHYLPIKCHVHIYQVTPGKYGRDSKAITYSSVSTQSPSPSHGKFKSRNRTVITLTPGFRRLALQWFHCDILHSFKGYVFQYHDWYSIIELEVIRNNVATLQDLKSSGIWKTIAI